MENKPYVSVLIPVYIQDDSQLKYLRESVDSVLVQTYQNFEIILINDGCIDSAKKVLNEYQVKIPQIRVHHNEKNLGIVDSLNKGIELAKGKLIARHDSDDICLPERFEKQVNYLIKHQNCDTVFTGSIDIDEFGAKGDYFPVSETPKVIKAELLFNSRLRHPSLMVRKKALLDIGGYREVRLAEDYDLFCRLSLAGDIHGINEALILYRRYNIKNEQRRQVQLENAVKSSFNYINQLLSDYALPELDKAAFFNFAFHIQSRGKTKCSIADLQRIKPLWLLIKKLPYAWDIWHKEIRNCIKHGYHRRSKIQACIMYIYLKYRLSI